MKQYRFKINGNDYNVVINSTEGKTASVTVNGTPYQVELEEAPAAPVQAVPVQAVPAQPAAPAAPAQPANRHITTITCGFTARQTTGPCPIPIL